MPMTRPSLVSQVPKPAPRVEAMTAGSNCPSFSSKASGVRPKLLPSVGAAVFTGGAWVLTWLAVFVLPLLADVPAVLLAVSVLLALRLLTLATEEAEGRLGRLGVLSSLP